MTSHHSQGFTLIELLVVIAIIGILASVILVSVNGARSKGIGVRIQAEVAQIRSTLEQDYANSMYDDLVSSSHIASLSDSGTGTTSIAMLACDIGSLLGYPDTVSGDLTLDCNGVSGVHTGVVIYSTISTGTSTDYGVYATSSPGYICYDSYGNIVSTTTAEIPAYADIASPATALCQ